MTRNPYDVLAVDAEASPEQIQAAYVHWAKRVAHDPDMTGEGSLKELQEAYCVLAKPEQRHVYDRLAQPPPSSERAEPFRATPAAEEPGPAMAAAECSLSDSFETYNPSFEELFDRFWSNFSGMSRPKAERLESLTLEIPLTATQARVGGKVRILIPARAQCPACEGHGAIGLYECWQCGGNGAITADYPLALAYPPGVANEYVIQVPLDGFGISSLYLTVRFRVTGEE